MDVSFHLTDISIYLTVVPLQLTEVLVYKFGVNLKQNLKVNKRFEFKKLVGRLQPWKLESLGNCHY